jgi:hypothetical protein
VRPWRSAPETLFRACPATRLRNLTGVGRKADFGGGGRLQHRSPLKLSAHFFERRYSEEQSLRGCGRTGRIRNISPFQVIARPIEVVRGSNSPKRDPIPLMAVRE